MNDTATNTTEHEEHRCPRRAEAIHQAPGPDTWTSRESLSGGIGPTCSYCGSLHPDTFMEKIRAGWIVEPTDKPYKAYLDKPYSPEDLERIKTTSAEWKAVRRIKLREGLTEDEATAAADTDWNQHEAPMLTGRTVAKFYFTHLSAELRTEFLELHNNGGMRLSYPGHFYVRPYFARTADQAAD
ncbi:hypothetical protein [Mycobacterium sp.]|uniref:hypothetical protein n=1 Tax=Mycobacterium sp. TaxID=1785 RepID=UPI002619EF7A|nr:hypothetical protein [Mycobacterium sp.]